MPLGRVDFNVFLNYNIFVYFFQVQFLGYLIHSTQFEQSCSQAVFLQLLVLDFAIWPSLL